MVEIWLLLAARKVYGLDIDTTPRVSPCSIFSLLPALIGISWVAMRRVLQLKAVTQCAMLESFGIFLVLADKVCT